MIAAIGLFSIVIGLIGCASPPPLPHDSAHTPPFAVNFNINDLEVIQEYEINIKGDKAKIKAVFLTFFFFDISRYDVGKYPINVYKMISKEQSELLRREFRGSTHVEQTNICKNCIDITAEISIAKKDDEAKLINTIITDPKNSHTSM